MDVRSRIKLLAGMAAVLGLCLAGAGCQTSSLCHDCNSPTCSSCATPGMVSSEDSGIMTKIRPLFVRKTYSQEPALAYSPGCDRCQSAVMLRPVPMGTVPGSDGSVTTVVQPASADAIATSEVRPAIPMERPTTSQVIQPIRADGELLPAPIPVGSGDPVSAAPPPAQLLPAPRPAGGSKASTGYPELPGVVVSHPVEAPREFSKRALSAYIIEPPDILAVEAGGDVTDSKFIIQGPHLVRPDGTIGLGNLGSVFVAGMTIDQAKVQVAQAILSGRDKSKIDLKTVLSGLKVDVLAYNSKFYYVITDGGGFGEQVIRLPCTGNEMVLDAIAQIQGLPSVASKKHIWVARATPEDASHPNILPVDWCGIVQRGSAATNYQIYPGDRIYVNSDPFIRTDSRIQKFLAPIERLLGATLLGSSVVNSIKNGGSNGGGNSTSR